MQHKTAVYILRKLLDYCEAERGQKQLEILQSCSFLQASTKFLKEVEHVVVRETITIAQNRMSEHPLVFGKPAVSSAPTPEVKYTANFLVRLADELMIALDLLSFKSRIHHHSVATSKPHVVRALDATITYVRSPS